MPMSALLGSSMSPRIELQAGQVRGVRNKSAQGACSRRKRVTHVPTDKLVQVGALPLPLVRMPLQKDYRRKTHLMPRDRLTDSRHSTRPHPASSMYRPRLPRTSSCRRSNGKHGQGQIRTMP